MISNSQVDYLLKLVMVLGLLLLGKAQYKGHEWTGKSNDGCINPVRIYELKSVLKLKLYWWKLSMGTEN